MFLMGKVSLKTPKGKIPTEFRIWVWGFGVLCPGFGVQGLEVVVQGSGLGAWVLEIRVQGSGFRVED